MKTKTKTKKKGFDPSLKDRARARHALNRNPRILQEMLEQGFHPDGRSRKSMKKVAAQMDAQRSWLGTSLLKQLVGQGYVRPVNADGYTITRKGLALLAA